MTTISAVFLDGFHREYFTEKKQKKFFLYCTKSGDHRDIKNVFEHVSPPLMQQVYRSTW